jgi:hypothetical protein
MKHILSFLFFICTLSAILCAQQISPVVLASNGGNGKAGHMHLDWTLGESAIERLTGQQHSFTEGFHQPIRIIQQVDITAPYPDRWKADQLRAGVSLSPNPASTELLIHFTATVSGMVNCVVLDANGIPQLHKTINASFGATRFDVSGLAPGLFFIQLIAADDGTTTVFKLLKVN